jgi:hypothetical protein
MSRSTVQDKLSGKTPLRLSQVLALVQACADYANSIGASLLAEDTDEQVWAERTQTALSWSPPSPAIDVTAGSSVPRDAASGSPLIHRDSAAILSQGLELDPLLRAGMFDIVDLIKASQGQPTANWLPAVLEALHEAQMSPEKFLWAASREAPHAVVESILAVARYNEPQASKRLVRLSTENRPAETIPILLALLRRKDRQIGDGLAEQLIDAIVERSAYSSIRPDDCADIVRALRSVTMDKDADRLLEGIGKRGDARLILKVAASFSDTKYPNAWKVINSIGKGSPYHIRSLLSELRTRAPDGIDPVETLDDVIFGIPEGSHAAIASDLQDTGLPEEAARVIELKDEPPF